MTQTLHFLEYPVFQSVCEEAVHWLENKRNVKIYPHAGILEECYLRAKMSTQEVMTERIQPNCVKKGGVFMYWISRLKPFRIWSWDEIRGQLTPSEGEAPAWLQNLPTDAIPPQELPDSCKLYLNETLAVIIGRSLAENVESSKKEDIFSLSMRPSTIHDLVVGLRYFTHSPHACNMILEASLREVSNFNKDVFLDSMDSAEIKAD